MGATMTVVISPFDPYRPTIAIGWSIESMNRAADRVNMVPPHDAVGAFAAIGETLWWVTLVNDTLRRRHPDAYDHALNLQTPRVQDVIEGLRSIRHRLGHEVDLVEIIELVAARPDVYGDGRVTAWRWRAVPPPTRSDGRDLKGYAAYQFAVEGRNIVDTFTQALCFLRQAGVLARDGIPKAV
jgi:hypothetical protein